MNREMQRVRIGLTGLAFVFLLVLLATVFTRASNEEPITANGIEQAATGRTGGDANAVEPSEPLAELGVTPGASEHGNNLQDARPVEDPLSDSTR